MQARLKVLHDKANVKQVKLLPVTLIGRSTDCNLKIASSQVSRTHCRITLGEDTVYIEDLGSANGTLVDGQRLPAHQPTAVAPGAALVVGPAEFVIDYVAPTSATMVLSRPPIPPGPDLPSTELLPPGMDITMQPGAGSAAFLPPAPATSPMPPAPAVAAPLRISEPQPPSAPIVPVAKPVVAVPVAAPVVATPVAAAVAPAVVAPVAVMVPALPVVPEAPPVKLPAPPLAESAPVESVFGGIGHVSETVTHDEAHEFVFDEAPEDASPLPVETKTGTGKKGGLKSLFSLFGRKGKQSSSATAQSAAAAPGVFLPAMEQPAVGEGEPVAEPGEFSFGTSEAASADVSADQTVTFERHDTTTESSGDEDDGFAQFLKQL